MIVRLLCRLFGHPRYVPSWYHDLRTDIDWLLPPRCVRCDQVQAGSKPVQVTSGDLSWIRRVRGPDE